MATITGKRFQITDGASTPTNLFPYTVSEAVYGLSNTISNAISTALSALSLSTYAGTSQIGSATQPVYYNGSALVATDLSTTYAPYNANGYLPLTGGTMSKTDLVTNLNADLLDGYNETAFFRGRGKVPANTDISTYAGTIGSYFLDTYSISTITNAPYSQSGFHTFLTTQSYGDLQLVSRTNVLAYRCRWSTWGSWHTIWHDGNSNKNDVEWTCSVLGLGTNHDSWNATRGESKIRLFSNTSTAPEGSPGVYYSGVSFMTSYNGMQFAVYGTYGNDTLMFRKSGDASPYWGDWRSIYHSGNANLSTVPWACSTLTASGAATIGSVLNITGTSGYAQGIRIHPYSGTNSIWFNCVNESGFDAGMWGITVDSAGMRFRGPESTTATSVNDYILIAHGGNVGFGTTSPTQKLHVVGNILATGAITAGSSSSSSDARLKSNIKPFSYTSDLLLALKPREWDWNEYSHLEGHSAGIVAQEIHGLMPYAVGSVSDEKFGEHLTMNYDTLHALEIAGLQDHESRIRQLEAENRELRKRLNMN